MRRVLVDAEPGRRKAFLQLHDLRAGVSGVAHGAPGLGQIRFDIPACGHLCGGDHDLSHRFVFRYRAL
jgi:hypothetical protein